MKFKEYLNESINDKGILKSCFMAGFPASGKSYVIKQIKSGSIGTKVVNTDTWVEFYGKGANVNWTEYGDKVKLLAKEQLMLYLNSLLPLWIDGTSSNSHAVFRRKGILESIGYDTGMVWVQAKLETILERNRSRKRVVDEDFIIDTYNKLEKYKNYYKTQFKPFLIIDNDDGVLTDDIILKAYKGMSSFFNSPIKNFIGQELKEEMISSGHKYLFDTDKYDKQYLNKLIDSWYVK